MEPTNQLMESINQITENARINLTKAADNSFENVTEKTNKLINGITSATTNLKDSLQANVGKIDNLTDVTWKEKRVFGDERN